MWIIIGIVLFIGITFIVASKNEKKQNEEFVKQGINPLNFIDSGKYISGHTKIDSPHEMCWINTGDHFWKIYYFDKALAKKKFIGEIDKSQVKNVTFEDETTIQTRVGLKRMLALGIFAFALKKKQKIEIGYIVIEWNDGKFDHETVFEFEGNAAISRANTLRNKLINSIS